MNFARVDFVEDLQPHKGVEHNGVVLAVLAARVVFFALTAAGNVENLFAGKRQGQDNGELEN